MTNLILLIVGGLGLVAILSYLLSELFTRPPRKPVGPTPADLGLPFEPITFASHDRRQLVGWLIGPRLTGPPVVILHGYSDHKSSYLDQARFLYDHGYPCLIYDQRGHGESSRARVSLGPLEAQDVLEALHMLQETGRGERFVLWGISMGAATALLAGARSDSVTGVISESSFGELTQVVADTLRLRFRLPVFPLAPLALRFASLACGVDLLEVDIGNAVEGLGDIPLQVVSGAVDPRMPPEVGDRLLARAKVGREHLVVAGADHSECWALGQPEYGRRVLALIESSLLGRLEKKISPASRR